MNKAIVMVAVLVVAGIAVFAISNNNPDSAITGNVVLDTPLEETESNEVIDNLEEFAVRGENFKFMVNGVENGDIVVDKGDFVRIEFSSVGGLHDIVIDELNVASAQIREADGTVIVEFIADTIGTFEYYCSVGSHREMGMKGNLIVK